MATSDTSQDASNPEELFPGGVHKRAFEEKLHRLRSGATRVQCLSDPAEPRTILCALFWGDKTSTGNHFVSTVLVELLVVSEELSPTGTDDLALIAETLVALKILVLVSSLVQKAVTAVYCNETEDSDYWLEDSAPFMLLGTRVR